MDSNGARFGTCSDVHCQRRGPLELEAYAADGSELWCCADGCGRLHSGVRGINANPPRALRVRVDVGPVGYLWLEYLGAVAAWYGIADTFGLLSTWGSAPLPAPEA